MENVTDIRHGYNSKEYICFSLLPYNVLPFVTGRNPKCLLEIWKENEIKGKVSLLEND